MAVRRLVLILVVSGMCVTSVAGQVPAMHRCVSVPEAASAREVLVPGGTILGAWWAAELAKRVVIPWLAPGYYLASILFGSIAGAAGGAQLGDIADDVVGFPHVDRTGCGARGAAPHIGDGGPRAIWREGTRAGGALANSAQKLAFGNLSGASLPPCWGGVEGLSWLTAIDDLSGRIGSCHSWTPESPVLPTARETGVEFHRSLGRSAE